MTDSPPAPPHVCSPDTEEQRRMVQVVAGVLGILGVLWLAPEDTELALGAVVGAVYGPTWLAEGWSRIGGPRG